MKKGRPLGLIIFIICMIGALGTFLYDSLISRAPKDINEAYQVGKHVTLKSKAIALLAEPVEKSSTGLTMANTQKSKPEYAYYIAPMKERMVIVEASGDRQDEFNKLDEAIYNGEQIPEFEVTGRLETGRKDLLEIFDEYKDEYAAGFEDITGNKISTEDPLVLVSTRSKQFPPLMYGFLAIGLIGLRFMRVRG